MLDANYFAAKIAKYPRHPKKERHRYPSATASTWSVEPAAAAVLKRPATSKKSAAAAGAQG